VRDSDATEAARRALGARLAGFRRAAGYSQAGLAGQIHSSRSTVANVETGRQHVPPDFWARADDALHAGGALTGASDAVEAAARRERTEAARRASLPLVTSSGLAAAPASPAALPGSAVALPGCAPVPADFIAAAAGRARQHAAAFAITDVGPGAIEQLTADVRRLGRAYVSAPPLPLFAAMHSSLAQVHAALGGRSYPAQARDLNFLAGALCALMANASLDLGREEAADDLARAAWTHAQIIAHGPLMGWARGTQALAAIWDHRYDDAIRHVEEGLIHVPVGTATVRLHAIRARALAAHGDPAAARAAITSAAQARGGAADDELHVGLAGEFTFDDAKLAYYHALALADGRDPVELGEAARTAVRLYELLPARVRSYGCEALARVLLARAQLMTGRPDAAAEALGPVLTLDPQKRIGSLGQPLEGCRQILSAPGYRRNGAARQLDRQLAAFAASPDSPPGAAQAPPGLR
jgi:DNA-binding XRE family transcriptional regulator